MGREKLVTDEDLDEMSVPELRKLAQGWGLDSDGKRRDLEERLLETQRRQEEEEEEEEGMVGEEDCEMMGCADLRGLCEGWGLRSSGKRPELTRRILDHQTRLRARRRQGGRRGEEGQGLSPGKEEQPDLLAPSWDLPHGRDTADAYPPPEGADPSAELFRLLRPMVKTHTSETMLHFSSVHSLLKTKSRDLSSQLTKTPTSTPNSTAHSPSSSL